MTKIKSAEKIANKWSTVTPQRAAEYIAGVQDPSADWQASTVAAAPTYDAALQASIKEKRFTKGVQKAGTRKWQAKTLEKGPTRWAQGVQVSTDEYSTGFEPYRKVIEQTTLPPRQPRGNPANLERVRVLADALHKRKVEISGV